MRVMVLGSGVIEVRRQTTEAVKHRHVAQFGRVTDIRPITSEAKTTGAGVAGRPA